MVSVLNEQKVRKIVSEEITSSPAIKNLDRRFTKLENEFSAFRQEFTEFKNQNLSLLDAIYKILKDEKLELDLTKDKVFENHEPRIVTLEEKAIAI